MNLHCINNRNHRQLSISNPRMLFYRTAHTYRHEGQAAVPETSRPASTRAPWMLKCLVVGTALLVLAYWLVQIAGAQYLATLTSATLLSFLLVYIVWCLTVKRRQVPQQPESAASLEPPALPTTSSASPAPSLHPALKYYGVPPRECSPPPSYDEVLRQMGAAAAAAAAAASTSGASPSNHYDVEAPPEDLEAPSSSALPACTIESTEQQHTRVPNSMEVQTSNVQESMPNDACLASTSTNAENLSVTSTASTSKATTPLSFSEEESTEMSASPDVASLEPASPEPASPEPTSPEATSSEPTSSEPSTSEPSTASPTSASTSTGETVVEVGVQPSSAEVTPGDASTTSPTVDVSIGIA